MSKKAVKRRRASAIVAIVAAAALMVGGTFAWQSISQKAANNTKTAPDWTGGRLHDDFIEKQNYVEGGNEDIYVENYSGYSFRTDQPDHEGRPVFVRVRLSEYMEIGDGAGNFKVDPILGDPIGYQDLDRYNLQDPADPSATPSPGREIDPDNPNNALPIITGTPADPTTGPPSILDLKTWQIHVPDVTAEDDGTDFHYYWEWDMGGSKVFLPTFNKDNESLLADRTEHAHDEYTAGTIITDDATYADGLVQSENHETKSTLESADVITMEEWIDLGSPTASPEGLGYWVGDTDGWFYWSKALMPTDATGLLLNGTTLKNEPNGKWYYGIHVTSQMASVGDWGTDAQDPSAKTGFYEDGLTPNAKALLNQAAGITPTVSNVQIEQGRRAYVHAGEAITFTANVKVQNPSNDPNETLITWSVDNGGTITQKGKLTTAAADVGKVYQVTASSAALPEVKTDTIQVTVLPAGSGDVITGEDDNTYLDLGDNTYQLVNRDGTIDNKLRYSGDNKTIGDDDDSFDVVVGKNNVKGLGPDADGAYAAAGPDKKLGTDDDVTALMDEEENLYTNPAAEIALGGTFTDAKGIEWQVIAQSGENKLIMTTASQRPGVQYTSDNAWVPLKDSNLMINGLSPFYSTKAGANVKLYALPVTIGDLRTEIGNPAWSGTEDATTRPEDISQAGTGTPTAENAPFILSVAEVNTYRNNIVADGSTWRLRTPGIAAPRTTSGVRDDNDVSHWNADNSLVYYRPALWVKGN